MIAAIDPRLLALRDALPGRVLRGSDGVPYYLRERIGEGGQGWVFRANRDDPRGYVVIVKVLRPDAVTPETLTRFRREADVLRLLGQQPRPNPHIVRFFDHAHATVRLHGDASPGFELPFTVLEYVHGPTLEQVLARSRGRGLPLERVRWIARHVVLALEQVHAQKIVHRDLKPSNILLSTEAGVEVAKVTDFGLVKLADFHLQRTTTLPGASLGYAPPEQYEQGNQRVGPWSDVFSLAAILYEMLAGRAAFPYAPGENPLIIVTRMVNGPRPMLARTRDMLTAELRDRPDLVDAFDERIARATAADPGARYPSVTELWAAVEPLFRALERPPSLTPASASAVADSTRARDGLRSSPSAWRFRVVHPALGTSSIRAAAFAPARGASAVAVGPSGLLRWDGRWTPIRLPSGLDPLALRGVFHAEDDLLVVGQRSLVVRLTLGGAHEVWALPDEVLTLRGVHRDDDGTWTIVGDRPARRSDHAPTVRAGRAPTIGALVQLQDGKVTLMNEAAGCARLRAATRLRDGTLVACGDRGALVRLELGVPEHVGSVCSGHLTAIHPLPDGGAVAVGTGGHALALSARLEAQLEAVQTTRDLACLSAADDGALWAGAGHARILRRTSGTWIRMNGELGTKGTIVAIRAEGDVVWAICDDGAVIEGTLG